MFKEKQKGFAHILLLVIIFGIGLVGYFGYKNGAIKLLTAKISPKCRQLPETGSCRAYFKKYYFDQKENKCSEFVWGGCHGVVPFETMQDCLNTCDSNTPLPVDVTQNIKKTSWEDVVLLIQDCKVKIVFQSHNLQVGLKLKDGTDVVTTEPVIDAVDKEIKSANKNCGSVGYATE